MKTFLILCVVLVTRIYGDEQPKHVQEKYDHLIKIVDICRKETGYTDEMIAEEENSNLNEEAGLKKFNSCFLEKIGFNGDEKFDIDEVLSKIPRFVRTPIIDHCKWDTLKNLIPDNVSVFSGCLHLAVGDYIRFSGYNIVGKCRVQTGFTKELLNKERESNFTEGDSLRKFNDCFLEKTGFKTSDGKLNIDAPLAKFSPNYAKPIIGQCRMKITTGRVQDFFNCFHWGVQDYIRNSKQGLDPYTLFL